MESDEDQHRIVTLKDLYRRANLPGLGELEIEEVDEEAESAGSNRSEDWTHTKAIIIGTISSLLAAAIWFVGANYF